MTHTLEQLKSILDNGVAITNGKDEIFRPDFRDEIYQVKGFNDNLFWWHNAVKFIGDPKDWQEVKKDMPVYTAVWTNDIRFAPRMIVIDAREWDEIQKELEALRNLIG